MSDRDKPPTCAKQTNILLYHQPAGRRKGLRCDPLILEFKHLIPNAKPHQIRVCTGAELKKMCKPPVCKCPQKSKGFLRFIGMGLKAAVAGAIVYQTYAMGLWGTPDDTQEMYKSVCTVVAPKISSPKPDPSSFWSDACKEELKLKDGVRTRRDPYRCDEPFVNMAKNTNYLSQKWNNCISCIFGTLINFPEKISNLATKIKGYLAPEIKKDEKCEEKMVKNIYK